MTIIAEGVSRSFDGVDAVRHVDLEARPGRVTALIGPNGAGKTTLLLVLATLLRPDTGRISVAGFDPATHTADVRRRLGWMPDSLGAWEGLTCRTALALTGRMYDLPATEVTRRATGLLERHGLGAFADRPTRVLSRGQKQRLSLCRALINDPPVLLLDEPASGIDPAAQIELRQFLLALAAEGRTVLVSSHDLDALGAMRPDVVFVQDGRSAPAESVTRALTARRGWRIRALDPTALERVLPELGVASYDAVFRRDGELVIAFDSEAHAADALARILGAGIRVSAFAPAVGELEQAFLDLATGRASTSPSGPSHHEPARPGAGAPVTTFPRVPQAPPPAPGRPPETSGGIPRPHDGAPRPHDAAVTESGAEPRPPAARDVNDAGPANTSTDTPRSDS